MANRGHQRERAVRQAYTDSGWLAFRAPASLGCADVIALRRRTKPRLIEVKSTIRPWDHFGPDARQRLLDAAHQAGAIPLLAWWPKNGQLKFFQAADWPDNNRRKK
jgi:Holliday junction resolvase